MRGASSRRSAALGVWSARVSLSQLANNCRPALRSYVSKSASIRIWLFAEDHRRSWRPECQMQRPAAEPGGDVRPRAGFGARSHRLLGLSKTSQDRRTGGPAQPDPITVIDDYGWLGYRAFKTPSGQGLLFNWRAASRRDRLTKIGRRGRRLAARSKRHSLGEQG